MRVGIDCKPLQDGAAGVRAYMRNLLRELASFPQMRLTCFCSAAFKAPDLPAPVELKWVPGPWVNNWVWTEWQLPRAIRRMSNVECRISNEHRRRSQAGGHRSQGESWELGNKNSDIRHSTFDIGRSTSAWIDLFHFPAYTASSRLACKKVVSVHDVSYAARPEWYPYSTGTLRQKFYRRSAESADAVITMSRFSKSEIVRVYSVGPERVFPIYLASGLEAVRPAEHWQRPGPPRAYLLHVGDLHTRRNLLTALDAFQLASADRDLEFVLVGKDLGARREIQHRALALGCAKRVHFLQDLALDQMPHWYRNAVALLYPSLYEGFGLPLLEAMQWGCPVVASRAASIPEVVGEAAWLVDPLNAREMADGIRSILRQPDTRELLVRKGFERARDFSWRKTAEQTVAVYRHVLERKDAEAQGRKA